MSRHTSIRLPFVTLHGRGFHELPRHSWEALNTRGTSTARIGDGDVGGVCYKASLSLLLDQAL